MSACCHAGSCTDPTGGPEPTADLCGMPAHPDCAAYEEVRAVLDPWGRDADAVTDLHLPDGSCCEPYDTDPDWGDCGKCGQGNTMRPERADEPEGASDCTRCDLLNSLDDWDERQRIEAAW